MLIAVVRTSTIRYSPRRIEGSFRHLDAISYSEAKKNGCDVRISLFVHFVSERSLRPWN
jgi:hypothetical protein